MPPMGPPPSRFPAPLGGRYGDVSPNKKGTGIPAIASIDFKRIYTVMDALSLAKYRGGFAVTEHFLQRRLRMRAADGIAQWRSGTHASARTQWDAYSQHISKRAEEELSQLQAQYQARSDDQVADRERIISALEHEQWKLRESVKFQTYAASCAKLKCLLLLWREQFVLNLVATWHRGCLEDRSDDDALRAQMQVDIVNKFAGITIFKAPTRPS